MTKKQMVYEILSNTRLHSINEKDVARLINKNSLERIERVYTAFIKDKEHALFYYEILQ